MAHRVYLFLSMLFCDRAGRRILVVSHGGTMWMFRYLLERWTYDGLVDRFEAKSIPNCGVVAYRLDEGLRRLVLMPDGDGTR